MKLYNKSIIIAIIILFCGCHANIEYSHKAYFEGNRIPSSLINFEKLEKAKNFYASGYNIDMLNCMQEVGKSRNCFYLNFSTCGESGFSYWGSEVTCYKYNDLYYFLEKTDRGKNKKYDCCVQLFSYNEAADSIQSYIKNFDNLENSSLFANIDNLDYDFFENKDYCYFICCNKYSYTVSPFLSSKLVIIKKGNPNPYCYLFPNEVVRCLKQDDESQLIITNYIDGVSDFVYKIIGFAGHRGPYYPSSSDKYFLYRIEHDSISRIDSLESSNDDPEHIFSLFKGKIKK